MSIDSITHKRKSVLLPVLNFDLTTKTFSCESKFASIKLINSNINPKEKFQIK